MATANRNQRRLKSSKVRKSTDTLGNSNEPGEPTQPPRFHDDQAIGVVSVNISIDSEDTMIENTKNEIESVLRRNDLSLDIAGDGFVVGNPSGRWFASQAADIESRFQRLESGLASQRMQLAAQEGEIAANRARIAELEWSSHGFSMTRSRFISTAKRDKLGTADIVDYDIIAAVNRDVHEGNAKFDATLYIDGTRMDDEAYTAIYGLRPEVINSIEYAPTITLLDRHATFSASNKYMTSPLFDDLFVDFVDALEQSGYAGGFLEGNPTAATAAYWAFMGCLKDEVKRINTI